MYKFELKPTRNNPYVNILSLTIYVLCLILIGVAYSTLTAKFLVFL